MTSSLTDREDLPIKWEHLIFAKNIFSWNAVPAREYYTPRRGQHCDIISIPELLPGWEVPVIELWPIDFE